jgi:guanidinopropionase
MKEIQSFFTELKAANVLPVAVGGDHSISLPILRSLATSGPVAMIHFDAHTDTWGDFQGSKFHHGSPFRWAVEEDLIDPKKTIQIGIRGAQNVTDGWDFSIDRECGSCLSRSYLSVVHRRSLKRQGGLSAIRPCI